MFKNVSNLSIISRRFFSTSTPKNNLITHLEERELIKCLSNQEYLNKPETFDTFAKENTRMYIGFDPTAESLHLGNLIGIMTALRFSAFGISPVYLLGGATGLIGDPTGKNKDRPQLTKEKVLNNTDKIKENLLFLHKNITSSKQYQDLAKQNQISNYKGCKVINNEQFYKDLNIIDFLREVGTSFRMGSLLSRDCVKNRIVSDGDGLSLTEFMYQTFQGYDFLRLFETENVKIQIGGSDQWGNMVSGLELIHKVKNQDVLCLTFPLLTNSNGQKFGKSEGNALFLNPKMTPINNIFQYFINVTDQDVNKMLKTFTFFSIQEINDILKKHQVNPDAKLAQKVLAESVISLLFSEEDAKKCVNQMKLHYLSKKGNDSDDDLMNHESILEECHKVKLTQENLNISLSKLCVEHNICENRTKFKRLISSGCVSINNSKVNEDVLLNENLLLNGRYIILKAGKKKTHVFEIDRINMEANYI